MTDFNPNSQMYLALQDFYPSITPSKVFMRNLFRVFEAEMYPDRYVLAGKWTEDFHKWLPSKIGLLRDPTDIDYDKFRVVDEKLYSFALLKYS